MDGDAVAHLPVGNIFAEREDLSRDFAARRPRQIDGDRQSPGFGPEIEVIHAASPDAHNHIVVPGDGVRDLALRKGAGHSVVDKLNSLHAEKIPQGRDVASGDFSICPGRVSP